MLIKRLFQPSTKARTNYRDLTWTLINGQFVIDDDNSNVYIEKGYKALPNLYGIISLIISKTSIVPHEVFRVKDQAKYRKYKAMMKGASTTRDYAKAMSMKVHSMEKVENSPLDELLSNPNPLQSAQEFNESLDGYLLLTGNSYIYGLELGSQVKELHSLIAPSVVIKTGDSFLDPVQGYSLSYMNDPIPREQIGHIKYWNPVGKYQKVEDIVYGLSPLKSCRTLLGKYREADIAQGAMFKNMGVNGILSGDNEMTQEQAVALKDRWKQLYGGAAKAGDIAVTSANVKWNQIGLSPVDLNILEGKEEILGELCNVYHTPIGMFTKTNSTENNMVEGRKMFITDAVIPNVERRKNVINKWLAPKFGPGLVVEYDYTVFGEMTEDMDKLTDAALKSYWLTSNEKRQMTNYDIDPDPNMDKYLVPSGLTPLDDIMAPMDDVDIEALAPEGKGFKYDPDQPRHPAGSPEGGQWVSDGSGGSDEYFEPTAIHDPNFENKKIGDFDYDDEDDVREVTLGLQQYFGDFTGRGYIGSEKVILRIKDHNPNLDRVISDLDMREDVEGFQFINITTGTPKATGFRWESGSASDDQIYDFIQNNDRGNFTDINLPSGNMMLGSGGFGNVSKNTTMKELKDEITKLINP